MSAEETLKLIAKQWCTLEDIIKHIKLIRCYEC